MTSKNKLTERVDYLRNVQRLTIDQISTELNMSKSSVRVFCSKHNIPRRNDHVEFVDGVVEYDKNTNHRESLDKLAKRFKIGRSSVAKIVPPRKKRGKQLLKTSKQFRTFAENNTLSEIVKEYNVSQKATVTFCKSNNIEINKTQNNSRNALVSRTVELIKEGQTNKQIADRLEVKSGFVCWVRKTNNLPPVTKEAKKIYTNELFGVDFYSQTETMRNKSKKLRSNLDSSVIDLFNEGKSLKEISKIKNCSDITVAKFLTREGIKYTTRSEQLKQLKQQSKEDFLTKSQVKFGHFKYDTSSWTGTTEHLTITCPEHGDFKQTPVNHLKSKHGCPVCHKNYQNTHRQNWSWDFVDFYTKNKALGQQIGLFYKLKFKHSSGFEFIKVGITSRSIKERYKSSQYNDFSYEVLETNATTNLETAILEREFLSNTSLKPFKFPSGFKFDGFTECFCC